MGAQLIAAPLEVVRSDAGSGRRGLQLVVRGKRSVASRHEKVFRKIARVVTITFFGWKREPEIRVITAEKQKL
jgi:hypothetical protein